jgi:hypothetical protein
MLLLYLKPLPSAWRAFGYFINIVTWEIFAALFKAHLLTLGLGF